MSGSNAADARQIMPSVSVVVPVRNEARYIEQCLANLMRQSGQYRLYEIIIADGHSTDATAEIVARIAARDPRVQLIANPKQFVSGGLNLAIAQARGEIIIRADAHTEYAEDYVETCVRELLRTGADNVGGPALTRARSYFQHVNSAAYHSWFAVGGARFHDPHFSGEVDTVPYGCWWKHRLVQLGLFDEELVRNQDDELNLRIVRSGGRVWQSSSIRSWYYPRATPLALYKQYYQYGYWKVRVIRKHRLPASPRHLIPATAVVIATLLLLLAPFQKMALVTLLLLGGAYLSLSVVAAIGAARRARRWLLLPVLPFAFFLYHAGYGLGFCRALLDTLFWRKRASLTATQLTR
jgi:succinoglycan biosynthesis protein ExoA